MRKFSRHSPSRPQRTKRGINGNPTLAPNRSPYRFDALAIRSDPVVCSFALILLAAPAFPPGVAALLLILLMVYAPFSTWAAVVHQALQPDSRQPVRRPELADASGTAAGAYSWQRVQGQAELILAQSIIEGYSSRTVEVRIASISSNQYNGAESGDRGQDLRGAGRRRIQCRAGHHDFRRGGIRQRPVGLRCHRDRGNRGGHARERGGAADRQSRRQQLFHRPHPRYRIQPRRAGLENHCHKQFSRRGLGDRRRRGAGQAGGLAVRAGI